MYVLKYPFSSSQGAMWSVLASFDNQDGQKVNVSSVTRSQGTELGKVVDVTPRTSLLFSLCIRLSNIALLCWLFSTSDLKLKSNKKIIIIKICERNPTTVRSTY